MTGPIRGDHFGEHKPTNRSNIDAVHESLCVGHILVQSKLGSQITSNSKPTGTPVVFGFTLVPPAFSQRIRSQKQLTQNISPAASLLRSNFTSSFTSSRAPTRHQGRRVLPVSLGNPWTRREFSGGPKLDEAISKGHHPSPNFASPSRFIIFVTSTMTNQKSSSPIQIARRLIPNMVD